MMSSRSPNGGGPTSLRALLASMFAVIIFSSVHWAAQPPSNVETIDASRLHLAGEFVEENLGTAVQPDGSVIVRVIAQQYSFVPSCIVVPAKTPVVFRVTSPDVVHGFLIMDTNVNSMVVPGIHRGSAHAIRQAKRSSDAVSRVLQCRSRGHVGTCQGRRSTGVHEVLR